MAAKEPMAPKEPMVKVTAGAIKYRVSKKNSVCCCVDVGIIGELEPIEMVDLGCKDPKSAQKNWERLIAKGVIEVA
jgi:hypothetical protein